MFPIHNHTHPFLTGLPTWPGREEDYGRGVPKLLNRKGLKRSGAFRSAWPSVMSTGSEEVYAQRALVWPCLAPAEPVAAPCRSPSRALLGPWSRRTFVGGGTEGEVGRGLGMPLATFALAPYLDGSDSFRTLVLPTARPPARHLLRVVCAFRCALFGPPVLSC